MSIDSFIYDGDGRSLSDRLRAKGFVVFVPTVAICMFLVLTIIGISIDWLYDKPFNLENHIYSDLPLDVVLSIFLGISTYFYKGKRLELKSDVIELDLNDNDKKQVK